MDRRQGLLHTVVRRPFDDALQAGRIGLWRAILGFDPSVQVFCEDNGLDGRLGLYERLSQACNALSFLADESAEWWHIDVTVCAKTY